MQQGLNLWLQLTIYDLKPNQRKNNCVLTYITAAHDSNRQSTIADRKSV